MRLSAGGLRFAPTLPAKWTSYRFQVHVQGALLAVSVDAGGVHYKLADGESLAFTHHGTDVHLTRANPDIRLEAA